MTTQPRPLVVNIPPPIGDGARPRIVHDAMWLAYVYNGCSAAETAEQLNRELKTRETRGSVVGYAHRQGWDKARLNGVPTAPLVVPAPKPAKKPLAQDPILPPERRPERAERVTRFTPPELKPKPEKVVDLSSYMGRPDPTFGPVKPEHLEHHHCKWPVGNPGTDAFRHCGQKRVEGEPYCRKHCDVAYPVTGSHKPKKGRR